MTLSLRYWPEVANKIPGTFVGRPDGVSNGRHAGFPGPTCALVLAILFNSVDEIETRLEAPHDQVLRALIQGREVSTRIAHQANVDGASL